MADDFKYWAFISYSHQDRAWGNWLHRRLETYRVPPRLVGRASRDGKVPRRLFPIFRDRDELPSSADLGGVINEALRQSRYQIVICSPRSATSKWVNEEVRHFKSLGREDRVLCFIVDGEPNASSIPGREATECFVPAIRCKVTPQGVITDEDAHPVAADAREQGDGKRAATLKLISGLIGAGFGELQRRERQRSLWRAVQVALLAAVFVGSVVSVFRWQERRRAEDARHTYVERLITLAQQQFQASHPARAAAYLSKAYSLGNTSADVRFLLARAMPSVEAMVPWPATRLSTDIVRIALSPGGDRLLSVHHDVDAQPENAVLWDAATGRQLLSLEGVPTRSEVTFSRDGARVLLSGLKTRLNRQRISQVWDLREGRRLLAVEGSAAPMGFAPPPVFVACDPQVDHVIVVNAQAQAELWDVATQSLVRTLGQAVYTVAYSRDGRRIVTGGQDGKVTVWDARTGERQLSFQAKPIGRTAAFFADGDAAIVTASAAGVITFWDPQSGEWAGSPGGTGGDIGYMALSDDGQRLVSLPYLGPTFKVWDVSRAEEIALNKDETAASDHFPQFRFSPDNQQLVIPMSDGLRIWSLRTKELLGVLEGNNHQNWAADFRRGGDALFTGGDRNSVVHLWDLGVLKGQPVHVLPHDLPANGCGDCGTTWAGFDRTGARIISAGVDGTVRLWNARDGSEISVLFRGPRPIDSATSDAHGEQLAMVIDRRASVLTVGTGEVRPLRMDSDPGVDSVLFSPRGDRVAIVTAKGAAASLWDPATGERVGQLLGTSGPITAMAFSPDGRMLATGEERVTSLWDAATGQRLRQLADHPGSVAAVAFSRDASEIATAGDEGSVVVWQSGDARRLHTVKVDFGVRQLLLDPAGMIIGGSNLAARWDAATGKVTILPQGGGHIAASPDGALLVGWNESKEMTIWGAATLRPLYVGGLGGMRNAPQTFSPDGRLLTTPGRGWKRELMVWDVALETRTPDEVAAVIDCKSVWMVDGEKLVPHAPHPESCGAVR